MTNFQPGLDRGSSYSGTLPVSEDSYDGYEAGPSNLQRTPSAVLHDIANYNSPDPQDGDMDDEYWEEPDEVGADQFINCGLLSHLAVQLRDKVPRGTHVKGSIPYSGAFTGKDIVVCPSCFEIVIYGFLRTFEVYNTVSNTAGACAQSQHVYQ